MTDERAWWQLKFKNRFIEAHGSGFEQLVRDILELRFPDDFIPVMPAGSDGDWKCDGFLKSQRRLLQVHGPKRFDKRHLLNKIERDYEGAVQHWPGDFDVWTLVHNSRDGLPPYAIAKLNELSISSVNPYTCEQWGYPKLRQLAFDLNNEQLTDLLGPAVTRQQVLSVELGDIIPLLRSIEAAQPASWDRIRPVSSDKLDRNHLSEDAESFLLVGMRRADAVAAYFTGQTMRPMLRDDIAARFSQKYRSLKEAELDPDRILFALVNWLTASDQQPKASAAAFAVIAYFFEQCDIYDDPSTEQYADVVVSSEHLSRGES